MPVQTRSQIRARRLRSAPPPAPVAAPDPTMQAMPLEIMGPIVGLALRQNLWLEISPSYNLAAAEGQRQQDHFPQAARFVRLRAETTDMVIARAWVRSDLWNRFVEYNAQHADDLYWETRRDWYRIALDHTLMPVDATHDLANLSTTSRGYYWAVAHALVTRDMPVIVLNPAAPVMATLPPVAQRVARLAPTLILRHSWSERCKPGLEAFIGDMPRLHTVLLPSVELKVNLHRDVWDALQLYHGLLLQRPSAQDVIGTFLDSLMPDRIYRASDLTPTYLLREVAIENVAEIDPNGRIPRRCLSIVLGRRLGADSPDPPIFVAQYILSNTDDDQHAVVLYNHEDMLQEVVPVFRRHLPAGRNDTPTAREADGDYTRARSTQELDDIGARYDAWDAVRQTRPPPHTLRVALVRGRYLITSLR